MRPSHGGHTSIDVILKNLPRNFRSIPSPNKRDELLVNYLTVINKSAYSKLRKQQESCKVIMEYLRSCPPGEAFDPAVLEDHLQEVQEVTMRICDKGVPPDMSATPLTEVLQFLGATYEKVVGGNNLFVEDQLRREMTLGTDYEVRDGGVIFVSHYGMRKIARRLTTPQANLIFQCMSMSLDVLKSSLEYSQRFDCERAKNLSKYHDIMDTIEKYDFEGGSNFLLNLEKKLLRMCFGCGKSRLIEVCGIDGEIRDATAQEKFITLSNTIRFRLDRKLKVAAEKSPDGAISEQDQHEIMDQMIQVIRDNIEDWPTAGERISDFLVCIPVDHRETRVTRSGKRVEMPIPVPRCRKRARSA